MMLRQLFQALMPLQSLSAMTDNVAGTGEAAMKRWRRIPWRFPLAAIGTTFLIACGTVSGPPITEESTALDLEAHGLALLGLTLANTFRISPLISPLETQGLIVWRLDDSGKEERLLVEVGKAMSKSADSDRQVEEQMLALKLQPGRYRLICVRTTVAKVGFVCAPVCSDFTIAAHQKLYLGHLDIVRRERKSESEPRAGFVIPLFDQWYSGFSTGTFDVGIRDGYAQDISAFKQRYQVLSAYSVENATFQALAHGKFDLDRMRCGD